MSGNYNIVVIGCGGIGGYLLELLPQVMACLMVDKLSENRRQELLASEGLEQSNLPSYGLFNSLILADGDSFSGHNALRQAGVEGSKLAVQMQKIRNMDAFTTWLPRVRLVGYDMYVTPENISYLFAGLTDLIVFLCVDNHKTRYEVSRWLEENAHNRLLLINGGNEKLTGNVTVYQKYYGTAYDPPLYKLYPDVNPNADKRPDEVHCGTVSVSNDQTAIINHMIASVMLNMFRKYIMQDGDEEAFNQKLRQKGPDGNPLKIRKNEVIIDLENNTMMALSHKADTDNRRVPVTEVENVPENVEFE